MTHGVGRRRKRWLGQLRIDQTCDPAYTSAAPVGEVVVPCCTGEPRSPMGTRPVGSLPRSQDTPHALRPLQVWQRRLWRSFGPSLAGALLWGLIPAGSSANAEIDAPPQAVVNADFLEGRTPEEHLTPSKSQASPSRTPIRRGGDARTASDAGTRRASPVTTLATLGLVLAVAYAVLALVKKRRGPRARDSAADALDVLCSRRLDGQTSLHLVRIGRKVLAIGSAPGEVRTLAEIEDPDEIAQLVGGRCAEPRPSTALSRSRIRVGKSDAAAMGGFSSERRAESLGGPVNMSGRPE